MTKDSQFGPAAVWALALLLTGAALLLPNMHQQGFLSSGDHGRELYAFAHIFDGKQSQTPYQDYWWMYGPLMPYYYGLCMKIFGVSVFSVLIGKTLLLLATGVFIGLTVMSFGPPVAGLAAAAWFWINFQNFYHTHNHTGGVAIVAALAFFLVKYIRTGRAACLWLILISAFLVALIKLNVGIVTLPTAILAVFLVGLYDRRPFADGRTRFFLLAGLAVPLAVAGIHALFLRGLTTAELSQCFPFGTQYRQYTNTPWQSILTLANAFLANLQRSMPDKIMLLLVWIAAGRSAWLLWRKQVDPAQIRSFALSLAALTILFVAMLHEYLFSNINYCLYWAQPVWITIMFVLLAFAVRQLSSFWRTLSSSAFVVMLLYMAGYSYINSSLVLTPEHFLRHPKVQTYVYNDPAWLRTVNQAVSFLEQNLSPNETFFAFPYDPLYYYLTGRRTPTWQSCFFAFQHVTPAQEEKTIADLERQKIEWVLVSNRIVSSEAGLGVTGRDYCPKLTQYLDSNFVKVMVAGDWQNPAGWAWNHGVMVLKRKYGR